MSFKHPTNSSDLSGPHASACSQGEGSLRPAKHVVARDAVAGQEHPAAGRKTGTLAAPRNGHPLACQAGDNTDSSSARRTSHPLVTVVVPAYNHPDYVGQCIESIRAQTYPNVELIVLNDGSTDATGRTIERALENYPYPYQYINKENEGLVKTLNRGLRLAKGKYCCQIASDDVLTPDSVEIRVGFLEKSPEVDVVFADGYRIHDTVEQRFRCLKSKRKRHFGAKRMYLPLLKHQFVMFATAMFRRDLFDRIGYFDEDFRFFEDLEMKFRVALHAKVGFLDRPVLYHRIHAGNISRNIEAKRREKLLSYVKVFDDPVMRPHSLLRRKCVASELRKYAAVLLRKDRRRHASQVLEQAKEAARLNPFGVGAYFLMLRALWHRAGAHRPSSPARQQDGTASGSC